MTMEKEDISAAVFKSKTYLSLPLQIFIKTPPPQTTLYLITNWFDN